MNDEVDVARAWIGSPGEQRRMVVWATARHFGLLVREVLGRRRYTTAATARGVAMALLRSRCGMSYPEIGQMFKRHHTSVMAAVRKADESAVATVTVVLDRILRGLEGSDA